jgi:hypothetical protein
VGMITPSSLHYMGRPAAHSCRTSIPRNTV